METKYTVIQPDGTEEDRVVEWPDDPGYDRIKSIVEPVLNGGWLEHVTVLFNGEAHDMFVDEEGRVPHKNLPRNDKATEIYRAAALSREPMRHPESLPWVAGPAVIFQRRVWFWF